MLKKFIQLVRKDIHELEYEAQAQYKYHRGAAIVWLASMILILFFPPLYSNNLGILIILEVSLYANFSTEFGSMSASEAAILIGRNQTTITQSANPGTIAPIVKPPEPPSNIASF
jgi:hypothetical protein